MVSLVRQPCFYFMGLVVGLIIYLGIDGIVLMALEVIVSLSK